MNVTDRPILSIIIPTKNRPQYVGPCVQSLMGIAAQDIEVIVQDNSDDDRTAAVIAPFTTDGRLHYNHCTERLSMSDNFTRGLEAATGEFVSFLGDDDGVNPEVVEAVRWAKAEGLDALVGSSAATYLWPDVIFTVYGKRLSASLLVRPFTSKLTYPDPEEELRKCVHMAGYDFCRLPKAYHGAVRRECLEQVLQKAGTYFPGPTPDMATAVALATVLKRYAHIDYPLFIPGTGRGSGGGAGTEKKHDWSIESVPWFSRRAIDSWSDMVPRFCCGTTLWAEDVVQALRAMGRDEVLRDFNAVFLYARCSVFNWHHNPLTFSTFSKFVRDRRINKLLAASAFVYCYTRTWYARLSALIFNVLMLAGISNTRRISDVADIDQAAVALKVYLRNKNRRFNERLAL